jgi:hypothetical protein
MDTEWKKSLNKLSFGKNWREQITKAQGLVEFALILPVMLMLIFTLIEIARILHAWMAVENGARTAIRYAVTAEYNPENCSEAGGYDSYGHCNNEADELDARVESVHEAAWAGSSSIVRVGFGEVNATDASYFNVVVCDPENLVVPAGTFDIHRCPGGEDPGDPGDQVIVVVEFNHPVLVPILNTVWPHLRLTALREAKVETYRIPITAGTPPVFNSPTHKPTNTPSIPTPEPTNTPSIFTPPYEVCEDWNEWHGSRGWDNATYFGGWIYERHGYKQGGPVVNEIILRNAYVVQRDTRYEVSFIKVGLSSNVQTIPVTEPIETKSYGYVTPIWDINLSLPVEDPTGEYYRMILLEAWFDANLTSSYYHIEGVFFFPEYDKTCYLNISASYSDPPTPLRTNPSNTEPPVTEVTKPPTTVPPTNTPVPTESHINTPPPD